MLVVPGSAVAPIEPVAEAADRPSIVVIYLDDWSPLAPWLFSDAGRTPTLARFVRRGTWFRNAIASTPMCCPARGNLLTGKYGHRTGMTGGDMEAWDPSAALGVQLQGAGYHTAYVGKYLNGLRKHAPTRDAMAAQEVGWDDFEVQWENDGRFYDYRWYTPRETRSYGSGPKDHASLVAARAAVTRIRHVPADQPLFMIVALHDGHRPYLPLRRFERHRACRDVRPWDGPAVDEPDVSDKPRHLRRTRRLGSRTFGLRQRCEEAMTVDLVVRRIRRALQESDRLRDTLLVLTSDNGIVLGDHRLVAKAHPYATPIPLYMLWPARLRDRRRVVDEPVSNVDLAPTFCALGGCTMPGADGMDLAPLLLRGKRRLPRDFVYEEHLHGASTYGRRPSGRPAWYGLRTTRRYSDTRWVYTEYQTGERELYDLSVDPHQLENLAGRRRHAAVERDLRVMLHERVIEPDGVRFLDRLSVAEEAG
jgi:arylsulfatase A-like enzyme